ncbi:MAG: type IV pilus modification protein PilV [Proteobacteria bacterium]|nr:type IV pilus modification protein PilV [Pseudomonadota bacterium]
MSLIEVLIAVLILGIGVLGIAAMQASALRNSQSSMQQTQAVIAANAMMDSMRANPGGAYALAMAGAPCAPPSAGATVASKDLNAWIAGMQTAISPSACGSVACAGNVCTVTVQWNETADPASPTNSVVIQSRLQ